MNTKRVALTFAATMTVCLIATASQGQRVASEVLPTGGELVTLHVDLDVQAYRPDGTRMKPGSQGGIAGLPLVNECFDGFMDGPVSGQAGWTTFAVNQLIPVVSPNAPIEGTKSVELPRNQAAMSPSNNGIFSPNVGPQPVGPFTCTAKLLIPTTTATGAQYLVVFQAPSQMFLTNQMIFFPVDAAGPPTNPTVVPDGDTEPFDILVLNDPDNAGPTPLAFFATGFEYTPGVVNDIRIEVDPANNVQRYFVNNVLIFTGTVYAGTAIEQAVVFTNNFHDVGEVGKTDCIAFEPGLPGGPACDGDADGDGDTDVDDLIAVILDWGCVGAPGVCDGDVNNSGATDVDDLIAVILDWGCT
jgi:hypothetical protein